MRKKVDLTVHRNTVERRAAKRVRDDMVRSAKTIGSKDIVAYAIVGIDAQGSLHSLWDTGACIPMWAFPATIAEGLSRDMDGGPEEDWRPSLQERKKP